MGKNMQKENGKFPLNQFWHMIFAYICTRIWQHLRRLGGIAVAIWSIRVCQKIGLQYYPQSHDWPSFSGVARGKSMQLPASLDRSHAKPPGHPGRPRGPDLEVFGTVEESEDLLRNLLDFPQFSPFWGQLQWDYPASSWWFSSVP